MQQWKNAVIEMDMTGWPNEAIRRVKARNALVHVDKKHVIMAIVSLAIIQMTVRNEHNISRRVKLDAMSEAKRMKEAFALTDGDSQRVDSIVTQIETRAIWSERLWMDSDELAADIEALVNKHLKHGMSLNDLQNILADHANTAQFNPKLSIADRIRQLEFNARRIVRIESARLIDEVNMTTYKMAGVSYVDWLTEPGACDLCQSIADGGPYAIDDAPDIPDDSHPNCRCHKTPANDPTSKLIFPYTLH